MSTRALLPTVLLLAACGSSPSTPIDAATTGDDAATSEPEERVDARLARYLTGRFSSEAQSREDANYFDIRLTVCPVDAPELGPSVLYVEQATASTPAAPYRQRLYVVEAGEGEGTAISRVLELASPAAWVGACGESERRSATAADATEKLGCAVHVRWDGARFAGGTEGQDCASTLNGASYTTSEVTITDVLLESWDRGYDATGEQVWGAAFAPYRFDRID